MISQMILEYIGQFNEDDEVEVILYGLKILVTSILTAIFVIFLGMIMGQVVPAIMYLGILILLRRNLGGYHSNTYIGCLVITSLNFLMVIFIRESLHREIKEVIGIIFLIFSTINIYKAEPTVNKNRVVNEEIMTKSNMKKNKALSIIVFLAIICYVFTQTGLIKECNYYFDISISLTIVALSIKNGKEEETYEQNCS